MLDTIYDFGMNNGDDVEYYLKKGGRVVGVEANTALCRDVQVRFAKEIAEGRLIVLNVVLSPQPEPAPVDFYVHKSNHVWSQATLPDKPDEFEVHKIAARTASGIIGEFGAPHYIKVDLEGLDADILAEVFAAGIRPDFISTEAHEVRVFGQLLMAGYDSFNLVDGASVPIRYRRARIATPGGEDTFDFRVHSAGPFGRDIVGPWLTGNDFLYYLADKHLGWKDIHATRVIAPLERYVRPRRLHLREHVADLGPSIVRALRWRLLGDRSA